MGERPETGSKFTIGGPIWAEALHHRESVEGMLQSVEAEKDCYEMFDEIKGMLTIASEELLDCPLYFDTHDVCRTVGISAMKLDIFTSALITAGYEASTAHCNSNAIKTNAPWEFIWAVRTTSRTEARPIGRGGSFRRKSEKRE